MVNDYNAIMRDKLRSFCSLLDKSFTILKIILYLCALDLPHTATIPTKIKTRSVVADLSGLLDFICAKEKPLQKLYRSNRIKFLQGFRYVRPPFLWKAYQYRINALIPDCSALIHNSPRSLRYAKPPSSDISYGNPLWVKPIVLTSLI